jgi:hypothetical protein
LGKKHPLFLKEISNSSFPCVKNSSMHGYTVVCGFKKKTFLQDKKDILVIL